MKCEQLSLFDLSSVELAKEPVAKTCLLSVGDKIAKVVLGECRVATITKIEGLPYYPFYRTDRGCCYTYKDGLRSVEDLQKEADANRKNYKTIQPTNLEKRFTVEYKPRECDGVVLWAQIGIFQNMLYWKENMTYQFLEPYPDEKSLMKAYNKRKQDILKSYGKFAVVDKEYPMRRLYWSRHGFYADAEYVAFNH